MSYLIDSDLVVSWLKGRHQETTLLRSLEDDGLAISLITYGEVYDGIYFGQEPERHEKAIEQFLQWVDVLPLNRLIMRRFARIRGHLRQTGQIIGDADILIAATALHYDLTLLTKNSRHFARIANLKLHLTN